MEMTTNPAGDSRKRLVKIVSFSGIDGAGKSTQIENLRLSCEQTGLRVRTVVFWQDIARLKNVRETAGHTIFKGDKGVGSPSAPIARRDKNVRSFPMTLVRLFIYFLDTVSARAAVAKALRSDADLVIFDRYVFDELANLSLNSAITRFYVRLILLMTPKPDISYILDADPVQARARKPEYPLDFLIVNRKAYLTLSSIADGMTVVPALPVDEVKQMVIDSALQLFREESAKEARDCTSLSTAQSQTAQL
jgi:thymidylate kinase